MGEHIRIEKADGVLTLVMARAEKKNALSDAMYKALADALESSNDDRDVRVILIQAEGDMFTAGNDLGEFAAVNASGSGPRNVTRFLHALATLTKPLVAAVQGRAVGVGTTMLLHCDQVILADNAQLSTPFVGLALVPEASSSLLLPARIGHARAFSMFALGEAASAHDALAWGIANKVVPLDQLAAASRDIAIRLSKQPLAALIATKRLMRDVDSISKRMETESIEFAARLSSPEAREAFTAFAERRTPDFSTFN
jgi:enoyl-CoA hydratase/carnithine racemase